MLLTVPLALPYSGPFVVLALTFRQRDLELGVPFFPVNRQGHQRIALPLDRSGQVSDLTPVQQQLSIAHRVGVNTGGIVQRREVCTGQEQFTSPDNDVAFLELCTPFSQAFDFPSLKRDSRFEFFLDKIIVPGLAIAGDGRAISFGLLGHYRSLIEELLVIWSCRCAAILSLPHDYDTIGTSLGVKTVTRSLILPYSAEEMYDLVADITHYQDFLPWCAQSQVLAHDDVSGTARIDVKDKHVNSAFTTRNHMSPKRGIRMELVDGPFSTLAGAWQFVPLDENACRVELEVMFAFSGALKERLMAPVFNRICNELADAFAARAVAIHGARTFD